MRARASSCESVAPVPAPPHKPVLSAAPYTTDHDQEFNHVVKIEDVLDEVTVKQELDIGPTVLTRTCSRCPPSLHSQCQLSCQLAPDEHLCTSSLGDTAPALETIFAQPTPSTKVADDYCKQDSGVPSDFGLVLCVGGIDYDTREGHQSTYCVRPRSECGCRRDNKSYNCEQYENNSSQPDISRKRIRFYNSEKLYKCKQCEYSASRLCHLNKHLCIHTDKKPYRCGQCEYSTSYLVNLRTHLRIHTGDKPYKCLQCEYSTPRLGDLKRHLRIHTGEKPYKCQQCEYSTSQIGNLKLHLPVHTGQRPFKCEQCEYNTSRLADLKRHLRVHTGEKPYRCEHCEYSTSRLQYLKAHLRIHTGEKPYKCG